MTNLQLQFSTDKVHQAQEKIEESIELVEISKTLFQVKLSALQKAIEKETSESKIKELHKNIKDLYTEYRKSLEVIEDFMEESYKDLFIQN